MGVKEKALTAASSIASGDFLRMVTSTGAARKIDYSKLAKAIVEEYNGSTIAGSAQTLKAALDSLNSNIDLSSEVITHESGYGLVVYAYRIGNIALLSYMGPNAEHTVDEEIVELPDSITPNGQWYAIGNKAGNAITVKISNRGIVTIWSGTSAALSENGRLYFDAVWAIGS